MTVTEQASELNRILAQGDLNCLFQPIISLSEREIHGYEALSRGPSNSPLHSPIALFSCARRASRLSELELSCRRNACRRFSQQQLPARLFLNVSPESLLETAHQPGRTLEMLQALDITPDRVVIELTEQAPIDNFKPFNDLYGYAKGDEVLLCLARCLTERVDPSHDFVGHIGGDDFMLVLGPQRWRERLELLLETFEKQCRRFYRSEHLQRGFFIENNRQGQRQAFGLLSLSLGVVHLRPEDAAYLSAGQLASLASQAKQMAKREAGSCIHVLQARPSPHGQQRITAQPG